MAFVVTGTTNSISKDSGIDTKIRLYYSAEFDHPETSESTVSIIPQVYNSGNLGSDVRFYGYTITNPGVYGGATTSTSNLYSLSSNVGGSNTLRATGNDWNDLEPYSGSIQTFRIKHGKDGKATFYGGVVGTVVAMVDSSKSSYDDIAANRRGCSATVEVPAPYSITYYANGGSGAPSSDSVFATYSYNLSETTPTRDGYEFKGWATSSSATTEQYKAGASVTITGNLNLYAVWKVNSYTLTLNKGTNIASVSGGGSKNYGASFTAVATLASATGYIYSFDGWYEGSTKKSSSLSYTSTMPASNLTLTAKGNARVAITYSVKFNANSGSGTMSNESFTYDVSKALTTNAFTRTGYTFKGWDTNSAGSTVVYTNGQSVKNLSSTQGATVNLYAVWQINTYTVSYNANGHGTAPASQTKTHGVPLTLRPFISNQTGSATSYTVTGDANGGTWSGSNGSATKTPVYSQTYWNTNSSGTGTKYLSEDSYTDNSSRTLYATWKTASYNYTYVLPTGTPTKNQTVTVTFNANNGSTTKSSQPSTRAMKFNGWYTEPEGGTKRTTSSKISADETVYAQYVNGTSAYPSVTLPTATQCTREGYNLLGWAASSSATTATYVPGASYTPTATTTLYAVWQKITYKLSLTMSNTGVVVNVRRAKSDIGGGSIGLLSNGDTLYYKDELTVSYSVNTGYTLQTATINGVTMGSTSENIVVTGNQAVVITVELGAIMYIGDGVSWGQYQIFIGDGASWHQYQAYIGNGASWDAY